MWLLLVNIGTMFLYLTLPYALSRALIYSVEHADFGSRGPMTPAPNILNLFGMVIESGGLSDA